MVLMPKSRAHTEITAQTCFLLGEWGGVISVLIDRIEMVCEGHIDPVPKLTDCNCPV